MIPKTKSKLIKDIKEFSETALLNYSSKRSFDYGTPHNNVSKLSPYIKTRFISEYEILQIVLKRNKLIDIEKYVEEIFWRTYWRGWLESHPWIYKQYEKNKSNDKFIPKKTGIKCFDHWKDELLQTGYLHNHSRMWFASIWIFTLGLSWESGANFFKNNLIDWCPASNTLGWRWVAGCQTIGKPYIAKANNIKYFTNNRFYPNKQLIEDITLTQTQDCLSNGKALDLDLSNNIPLSYNEKLGIILNNNDLTLDQLLDDLGFTYHSCLFIKQNKNNLINNFNSEIYDNILENKKKIEVAQSFNEVLNWIESKKIKNLILPYETIGNKIFHDQFFLNKISDKKINYFFYLRQWDKNAFPYTKKGFFNFKKNIPQLLDLCDLR